MRFRHPTGKTPAIVDIVACGPTLRSYNAMRFDYSPIAPDPDEVWTLNKALRTVKADLIFIMDDLVGEYGKSDRYRSDIDNLEIPVITSIIDSEVMNIYPNITNPVNRLLPKYPLNQVVNHVGLRVLHSRGPSISVDAVKHAGDIAAYYLHNSIPYMLAYALFIGVKRVQLFGADYTFPGMAAREDDRANTEYWVGLLRAFGVEVFVTHDTTLLSMNKQPWLYGYGARPPAREAPGIDCVRNEADRLWPGAIDDTGELRSSEEETPDQTVTLQSDAPETFGMCK